MVSRRSTRGFSTGFTLVELMIVVVILGILAAIAIPAFTRYVKKSKTAEATGNISRIVQGQVTAYQQSADIAVASFVSAGPTPSAAPTESKYPANPLLWTNDPQWSKLGFSIDTGHYYQYTADASGGGGTAVSLMLYIMALPDPSPTPSGSATSVTTSAGGDLDGDGVRSSFSRTASLNAGEIQLSQLNVTSELE